MPRFQTFHYGALATLAIAAVAVIAALLTDQPASALLPVLVAAVVILIVLADRRMLKTSQRRAQEHADLHKHIDGLELELDNLARNTMEALGKSNHLRQTCEQRFSEEVRTRLETLSKVLVDLEAARTGDADRRDRQFRSLERNLALVRSNIVTDIQALIQLLSRFEPSAPLPILSGWAVGPTGLVALHDIVQRHRPHLIVECGSGTSTLWLAYFVKERGYGRVIALEHNEKYAAQTRDMLAAHELSDLVDVRLAPLRPTETPRGVFQWYELNPSSLGGQIDLLIVDGPPGATGPHARYPALPVLRAQLAPDAVLLLDDTERSDEREMVEFWLDEEPTLRHMRTIDRTMDLYAIGGESAP
ncbi:conserved hypothetical protein [Xylanimonas cellulosilytica DSM 15894]|uniref:Uncharacterized protein n=1 Tax=Xylanimonas cellulosilytica (strain DSM 15894 / JCM 12276 / CECT 5975 / KCTC 9989 / LMG 20990 / NBRC 107835 / XIL07) TaxID=446471 RepID=D1BX24_XYLCX|nr:class I SAM-dependent methyltransferase [Xylanimonas cellulosilytica]ACZ31592.1 conserved hypothetical protein [Xylanimonas cellulosilytica DSM 15894]